MIAFGLPIVGSLKHGKSHGLFDEVCAGERKEIDRIVGDSHVADLLTRHQGTVTHGPLRARKDRCAFGRPIRKCGPSQILPSAARPPAKTRLGHFGPTRVFSLTDCTGKRFNSFLSTGVGTFQPTPPIAYPKSSHNYLIPFHL
jgi:hypothetical protein